MRRLKDEFHFNEELAKKSHLFSAENWMVGSITTLTKDFAIVNDYNTIAQAVEVEVGRLHHYEVLAKCGQGSAQGRMQSN